MIQRYHAYGTYGGDDGPFVEYDDHLAAMAAKDAEIARLQGDLAGANRECEVQNTQGVAMSDLHPAIEWCGRPVPAVLMNEWHWVPLHMAQTHINELETGLAAERARAEKAEAAAIDTAWLVKDHERLEAALRELGKHPESCGDDCVSELARQDVIADRDRLQEALTALTKEFEAIATVVKPLSNSEALVNAKSLLESTK